MSEIKPDYTIDDDITADALHEQMALLHREYDELKMRPGEFTVKQYKMINGIGDDRARSELDRGIKDGKVRKRKVRNRLYYSFVSSG